MRPKSINWVLFQKLFLKSSKSGFRNQSGTKQFNTHTHTQSLKPNLESVQKSNSRYHFQIRVETNHGEGDEQVGWGGFKLLFGSGLMFDFIADWVRVSGLGFRDGPIVHGKSGRREIKMRRQQHHQTCSWTTRLRFPCASSLQFDPLYVRLYGFGFQFLGSDLVTKSVFLRIFLL